VEFDPYSREFFEDPWDMYRWLRDEQPLYRNERLGFYAVSRYEDCVEVHRDVARFTSTRGVTLDQLTSEDFGRLGGSMSMIMMDPPMHDRLRKLVNRAFTPRRIQDWEPVVQRVIGRFLDEIEAKVDGTGAFDAVHDLSGPFPVEVICEIVGIPEPDRQQIRHWTDGMLHREVGNPFPSAEGIAGAIAFGQYLKELVDERRAHPQDAMLDHLVAAEVEREDGSVERLSDDEVIAFVILLTGAGAETVTKLVGNGVVIFDEWPDERRKLQARPDLAPAAVEELLRYRAPSQYQGRFCVEDVELHGQVVPAGSPMLVVTGAAGRDPRAYDDPDRFDIERAGAPLGISFGHGIHYCIGAHLARLEGRTAFAELYRRWPDLAVDRDGIQYVQMANVAGPSSVPVSVS
jgi:cytochrome P450